METTARTTGADAQAEELRRRNVTTQPPAAPVTAPAQDKEKSKDKVCITARAPLELPITRQPKSLVANQLQPFDLISALDEYEFIWAPLIFTFFAFFTRMYKIGLSPIVTWDEAQ